MSLVDEIKAGHFDDFLPSIRLACEQRQDSLLPLDGLQTLVDIMLKVQQVADADMQRRAETAVEVNHRLKTLRLSPNEHIAALATAIQKDALIRLLGIKPEQAVQFQEKAV